MKSVTLGVILMAVTIAIAPTPNTRVAVQLVHSANKPLAVFTVTNDDGVAIDLSSDDLVFNVFDKYGESPDTVLASYATGGAGLVVSGDDDNIVTLTYDEADFDDPGLYEYELWITTGGSKRRICGGVWELDRRCPWPETAPVAVSASIAVAGDNKQCLVMIRFDRAIAAAQGELEEAFDINDGSTMFGGSERAEFYCADGGKVVCIWANEKQVSANPLAITYDKSAASSVLVGAVSGIAVEDFTITPTLIE